MPVEAQDRAELARAVGAIRWAHRIDLGNGIVTPGLWDTPAILNRLKLPQDLTGQTVLDVGCWDGFYSFEAERRGAPLPAARLPGWVVLVAALVLAAVVVLLATG